MSLSGESDVLLSMVTALCTAQWTYCSLGMLPRPLLAQRILVSRPMTLYYMDSEGMEPVRTTQA